MSAATVMDWVVQTGLDVSLLVLLILLVRKPFTKFFGARAAYALWLLPVLRLFLPDLSFTLNLPAWLVRTPELSTNPGGVPMDLIFSGAVPAEPIIAWQLPVLMAWICGAILWLGLQLVRQRKTVSEITDNCMPPSGLLTAKTQSVSDELGLRKTPKLLVSRSHTGPLVTGLIDPVIVLPANFETDFDPRQQRLALLHELAHIKRKDLWAAGTMLGFRALNWPNPLVHFSARRFRADQEAACDAFVLSKIGDDHTATKSYAETLIHSAKLTRVAPRDAAVITPLCLTIYHPLKERLMTMKNQKNQTTILSRLGVGAFVIAALTATAPLTIATAQEAEPKIEMRSKKVIKMKVDKDGVVEDKHYEITSENGETQVVSIDQHGNRTVVDKSELENIEGMENLNVNVFGPDGSDKHIEFIGDGTHGGAHEKIVVRRMAKDGEGSHSSQVYAFSTDEDINFETDGSNASTMVRVAKDLITRAGEDDADLSSNARRKLDKARKALEEAEKALADE